MSSGSGSNGNSRVCRSKLFSKRFSRPGSPMKADIERLQYHRWSTVFRFPKSFEMIGIKFKKVTLKSGTVIDFHLPQHYQIIDSDFIIYPRTTANTHSCVMLAMIFLAKDVLLERSTMESMTLRSKRFSIRFIQLKTVRLGFSTKREFQKSSRENVGMLCASSASSKDSSILTYDIIIPFQFAIFRSLNSSRPTPLKTNLKTSQTSTL